MTKIIASDETTKSGNQGGKNSEISNLIFAISGMSLIAGSALTAILIVLLSSHDSSTKFWSAGVLIVITTGALFIGDRAARAILKMHRPRSV